MGDRDAVESVTGITWNTHNGVTPGGMVHEIQNSHPRFSVSRVAGRVDFAAAALAIGELARIPFNM